MTGTPFADLEFELAQRFVRGDLDVGSFIPDLLHARNQSVDAHEITSRDFEGLLDDIWFAIDTHNEYDDLREPDEFDDAQLHEVVTQYLADWDAGTWQPDPRWAR